MNKGHVKNDGVNTWVDMLIVSKSLDTLIGRNNLLSLLREERYLMEGNIPYQKYVDSGHFKMEIRPNINGNGKIKQWYGVALASLKGIDLINKVVKDAKLAIINTGN